MPRNRMSLIKKYKNIARSRLLLSLLAFLIEPKCFETFVDLLTKFID